MTRKQEPITPDAVFDSYEAAQQSRRDNDDNDEWARQNQTQRVLRRMLMELFR